MEVPSLESFDPKEIKFIILNLAEMAQFLRIVHRSPILARLWWHQRAARILVTSRRFITALDILKGHFSVQERLVIEGRIADNFWHLPSNKTRFITKILV